MVKNSPAQIAPTTHETHETHRNDNLNISSGPLPSTESVFADSGRHNWTGRQLREGKRGAIPSDAPNILQSLGPTSQRWILRVNAIGSGYWRVVGEAHDLIATAQRIGQQWVKGLGLAKKIARIV